MKLAEKIGPLVQELQQIVGKKAVLHEPEELMAFEYDGSIDKHVPDVVVFPSSTEEVSRIMALAHREKVPVVPRGAGTGLSGGAVPVKGGMVIAVTRMKNVLEIDPVNRMALVDPGVTNIAVDLAANAHGLRFAPDPASQKSCTVGGNIGENAGGPHCLAYGVTTNHTLGMEVVLEDGTVTWLGAAPKDPPGYDLRGVFIGSEGTFGIVTKILFRLLPVPETINTMLAIYPELDQACQAVAAIIARGIVPATLELMDNLMIRAVESARHLGYPEDAGAILLVELEGLKEEVAEVSEPVQEILKEKGASEVQFAEKASDRERLWIGRKGSLGALGTLAPNYMLVDGTVPRSRLPRTVERVQEIAQRYEIPVATLAHAGDGNLHPCILFDERVPGTLERVAALAGELLTACVDEGGTLSGEHGIGVEKNPYMSQIFSDQDMDVMRRVRRAFSPSEIINPGNVFPEDKEPAPVS